MAVKYKGKHVKLYHLTLNNAQTPVFQVRYKDEIGKEVRKRVPGYEDPVEYAKGLEHQIKTAGSVKVHSNLFREAVKDYDDELLEHVQNYKTDAKYGEKIAPGTYKKNAVYLNNHILPVFGDLDVQNITPAKIMDFQKQLVKKISPAVANQVVGMLGRCMSFFVRKELILYNPCREIKRIQEDEVEPKYVPTRDEVQKVIDATDELWKTALLKLCAETGCRIGEALALKWTCVKDDIIFIKAGAYLGTIQKTKTKKSVRKVKISPSLVVMLKELRLKSSADFVFVNSVGKIFMSTEVLKQVLYRACDVAGVSKFSWNGLRRYYINSKLDGDVRLDHIQKMVGHAIGSRVTNAHYIKIRDEAVLIDDYVEEFG